MATVQRESARLSSGEQASVTGGMSVEPLRHVAAALGGYVRASGDDVASLHHSHSHRASGDDVAAALSLGRAAATSSPFPRISGGLSRAAATVCAPPAAAASSPSTVDGVDGAAMAAAPATTGDPGLLQLLLSLAQQRQNAKLCARLLPLVRQHGGEVRDQIGGERGQ